MTFERFAYLREHNERFRTMWLDLLREGIASGTLRSDLDPELVAVEEGTAYLRLSGGCQGCGMASVTLSQGIEVVLKESVPEITKVVDVTDHASGTNPYFESAKK
jgi:Fe-S cluster biogenesis protein NfuA